MLLPHLDDGPVMLTEFTTAQSELPAVVMMKRVHAPADLVAGLIANPEGYESFMPALDRVDVRERAGLQIVYRWEWSVAIFALRGDNIMTVYPGHPTRGHRIDIVSHEGDLGVGRFLWRIYPESDDSCIVVFSSRIDMRNANYLSQRMASGGNSVNRTVNIALSMTMLLATSDEAERMNGTTAPTPEEFAPLTRPQLNPLAYLPLLSRGDLVFMHIDGDRLQQVDALGRGGVPVDRMRHLMASPEYFGSALIQGSRAETLEVTDAGTRFGWGIPLPLVAIEGEMMLRDTPGGFQVDGLRGSLSSARFRFDTFQLPWPEAGVLGWSRFDPAETAPLVRRIIAGNHYFSHGLVAATQVMIIRSLRSRVRRM